MYVWQPGYLLGVVSRICRDEISYKAVKHSVGWLISAQKEALAIHT